MRVITVSGESALGKVSAMHFRNVRMDFRNVRMDAVFANMLHPRYTRYTLQIRV